MFKSHNDPGFHMTFANGITVSVQWSLTHYRTGRYDASKNKNESIDAEVSVWTEEGPYLSIDAMLNGERKWADRVLAVGWLSAEQVALILHNASKL